MKQEFDDRRRVAGRAPGLYHIAEILPDVLATIAAKTHCDMDDCPRPVLASHVMPAPGVLVEA
jgi:hypothetical protein